MIIRKAISVLGLFAGIFVATNAFADVTLPAVFSDHMVLQRDAEVPVWGWADPGEKIVLSIAGQTKNTVADADGKWRVTLDKLTAGEPVILTVKGRNTVTVRDVLIGEVWLASGQSNMQLNVGVVTNAWQERASAKYPQIRMFTVARHQAITPQTNCQGEWVVCSPETVGNFSAAAYFFGRELHQKLGVPVGLINASWGGTPIDAWISMPRMEGNPAFAPPFQAWAETMRVPSHAAQADAPSATPRASSRAARSSARVSAL